MRGAQDHCTAAFISSVTLSDPLLQYIVPPISFNVTAAVNQLLIQLDQVVCREELVTLSPKVISFRIDAHNRDLLSEELTSVRDRARLGALSLPHAGDFLFTIPSPVLGLPMRSDEFRLTVCYRLGIPVFDAAAPCPACHRESDRYGDHAILCGTDGERIARHNHLRDALYSTAAAAALGPLREERALLPGSDKRPADVYLPNWSGGRDTALDVTVVNPLRNDYIEREAESPGYASDQASKRKMGQVGQACEREGLVFIPLAVETFGGWGKVAVLEIKIGICLSRQKC